jgi:hypothetical protein
MMFHPLRAVSRRPPTSEARVQPRFELCGIIGCGQFLSQVLRFSPIRAIPPMLLTHIAVTDALAAWQLTASLNNTPYTSSTMPAQERVPRLSVV